MNSGCIRLGFRLFNFRGSSRFGLGKTFKYEPTFSIFYSVSRNESSLGHCWIWAWPHFSKSLLDFGYVVQVNQAKSAFATSNEYDNPFSCPVLNQCTRSINTKVIIVPFRILYRPVPPVLACTSPYRLVHEN